MDEINEPLFTPSEVFKADDNMVSLSAFIPEILDK